MDDEGSLVQRKGFLVECKTDLDCFSRCGTHPVSGTHYVCTHNLDLYSLAGYSKSAYKRALAESDAHRASGKPHTKVWLPSSNDESFYLMDEPGDDEYDIQRGTGVCTDTHIDYLNTGCLDSEGAKATLSISGCSGRAFGWSTFFCGVEVDYDEDYVTDAALSTGSLLYPRTLVEEAQVNGKTMMRVTCGDPFTCTRKCDRMERTARDGGLPAPTACALCSPPCPTNIGMSVVTFVKAFRDDVVSAIELARICMDPTACVCQVFMMIKPAWIDNLPNEIQECSVADLMMMILDKVAVALISLLETSVNGAFIDPINKLLKPMKDVKIDLGFTSIKPFDFLQLIGRLCIPYKDIKDCKSAQDHADLAALLGCSFTDASLWKRCYYERVKSICLQDDDALERYQDLFEGPTSTDLQAQFQEIVGDSFQTIDPSMQALFDGANQEVNVAAQDICSDLGRGSLSFDKAIMACLFHHVEGFCPSGDDDENIPTFLKTLRWKLDEVVWDWAATPPPPPPVVHGSFEDLVQADPEGMELARDKILELWPQLS